MPTWILRLSARLSALVLATPVLAQLSAVDDSAFVCSGTTTSINVLANDVSSFPLFCHLTTVSAVSPASAGTATIGTDPASVNTLCPQLCVVFQASPSFSGSATFTYTISAATLTFPTDTATVTVSICGVSTPDHAATVCPGGVVDVCLFPIVPLLCGGIATCSAVVLGTASQGTASQSPSSCYFGCGCCIRYTAPVNPSGGTATFAYTVSTSGCSDTGTVTVTFCTVAAMDDAGSICAGATAGFDVLANDTTTCGSLDCTTLQLVPPVPAGFSLVGCGTPGSCAACRIQYAAPANPISGTTSVMYQIGSVSAGCAETAVLTLAIGQQPAGCGGGLGLSTQTFSDCYGCPLGSTMTNWSTPSVPRLRLPKVVLAPGQALVGAEITQRARYGGVIFIENTSPGPCFTDISQSANLSLCASITPPGTCPGENLCLQSAPSLSQSIALAPYDGVPNFAGPSGTTRTFLVPDAVRQTTFSSSVTLAHFTDGNPADGITEYVEFDHSASASSNIGTCFSVIAGSTNSASMEATVVYTVCTTGVPFCPGDGTGTACPCANQSPIAAGLGCTNSTLLGGELRSTGFARLSADTLSLRSRNLTGGTALFVQGTLQDLGGLGTALGDGLRCVNGSIVRLATNVTSAGAAAYPQGVQLQVSVRGAVLAPGSRYYQVQYRNAAAYCPPATFNLTNGLWIEWVP